MLMQCQEARRLLHDLVDDDIDQATKEQLQQHLGDCRECREAERSLRQTVDMLQEFSVVQAPEGFTAQLIGILPRSSGRLISRVLSIAAALLLVLASPVYFSNTLSQPQLICGDRQASIVQVDGRFVIPADQTVNGNITVYRSDLLVQGKVMGNVQVVDGRLQLDSSSSITGQVSERASSGSLRMKLALAELWEDIGGWLFFR